MGRRTSIFRGSRASTVLRDSQYAAVSKQQQQDIFPSITRSSHNRVSLRDTISQFQKCPIFRTAHLSPSGGENTLGLCIEEPWREIKHSTVHFPIDQEAVVIQTAGGLGSSAP